MKAPGQLSSGWRGAAARDAVALASTLSGRERIVLAASDRTLAEKHPTLPVTWDFDWPGVPFHFGRRLGDLMAAYPAQVYVYLGVAG